jgi:molybdopterin synthase sulfur carrier subunit
VKVRIPTPLRSLAGGAEEVSVEGGSVDEALKNLEAKCPGMRSRLCDQNGELRRFINLYVNDQDIRSIGGLSAPLKSGDSLSIIPAIAGGTR